MCYLRRLLLIIVILSKGPFAFSQPMFKQDLGAMADIIFPDTPKVQFSGGATYYIYKSDRILYFAQVVSLNTNPDSLKINIPNGLYQRFIKSTLSPIRGKTFFIDSVKKDSLKGVSFGYKCLLNDNTYYGYSQAFRVDSKLLSYSIFSPDSLKKENQNITSFFNTFTLTPERAKQRNKQSGLFAGLIMLSFAIFFGGLLIFLVKRSQKKAISY